MTAEAPAPNRPVQLAETLLQLSIPADDGQTVSFENFLRKIIEDRKEFEKLKTSDPLFRNAVMSPFSIESGQLLLDMLLGVKGGGEKPSGVTLAKANESMKELLGMYEDETHCLAKGLSAGNIEINDPYEGESWKHGIAPDKHQADLDSAKDSVMNHLEATMEKAQGIYDNLSRAQAIFEKLAQSLGHSLGDEPQQAR